MEPVRRFRRDARAAVAIISAVAMTGAIAALAVAVDTGSVYVARREAQGAVDLAAIAAARDLVNAQSAAEATLAANGIADIETVAVTLGRYEADLDIAPEARFTAGATPANAARVELRSRAALYFGRYIIPEASVPMETRATASNTALASFSIGSRLASLDGGIANVLLSGLLGGNLSLSAMDYTALVDLDVGLLDFTNALATVLDIRAGTYADVLAAQADVGDIIAALALVSQGGAGGADATAALGRMASQSHADSLALVPQALLDLGPYAHLGLGETVAGAAVKVSAYDLLRAAAEIANSQRQIDLNLGAAVPGLLGLTARLAVGERPQGTSWVAVGAEGASVYTAQTRLRLVAEIGGSGLLLGARIRVPVHADIAAARATLSSVSCGREPAIEARVAIAARPGVAHLWIGEPRSPSGFWGFSGAVVMDPATLVEVPLLARVKGLAHAEMTNIADDTLVFDVGDIADEAVKAVKTRDFTQTLLPSLIGSLHPDVTLLGLPLGGLLSTVTNLVTALVSPLGALLDPVLNALLDLLGVSLGEADVRVHGVRCDGGALVG